MLNSIINSASSFLLEKGSAAATDTQAAGAGAVGCGGMDYTLIIVYIAIFAALYFFMIRPNSKKKKQEQELKKNIDIGDDITTIGGICGKVVAVRDEEDEIIVETGSDRVKLRFKKWCIYSNNTAIARQEEEKKRALEERAKAKEKKKAEKAEK